MTRLKRFRFVVKKYETIPATEIISCSTCGKFWIFFFLEKVLLNSIACNGLTTFPPKFKSKSSKCHSQYVVFQQHCQHSIPFLLYLGKDDLSIDLLKMYFPN